MSSMRSLNEVHKAESEFFDKVWFYRHQQTAEKVKSGQLKIEEDIWKGALKAAQEVIKKYGKDNVDPYSDYELGMLEGKLSALRWVLGDVWDMLDT